MHAMAKGWAIGLAEEWDTTYRRRDSSAPAEDNYDYNGDEPVAAVTTLRLRSILEAALPAFLFVCIALRLANAWDNGDDDAPCNFCLPNHDENGTMTAISTMVHTL